MIGAANVLSQSFFILQQSASKLIQSDLFKILFYDGMFGIVIATRGMNPFRGSLYDFECITHDFLGQYVF